MADSAGNADFRCTYIIFYFKKRNYFFFLEEEDELLPEKLAIAPRGTINLHNKNFSDFFSPSSVLV